MNMSEWFCRRRNIFFSSSSSLLCVCLCSINLLCVLLKALMLICVGIFLSFFYLFLPFIQFIFGLLDASFCSIKIIDSNLINLNWLVGSPHSTGCIILMRIFFSVEMHDKKKRKHGRKKKKKIYNKSTKEVCLPQHE